MAGRAMVPAYFGILDSLKFRLILPKNRPREWRAVRRFLGMYAGLLVDDAMIAEFTCCRMLEQNTMGSNADGERSAE
jgi:hypothetical protein